MFRYKKSKGFSLIELLIVVAIIGVLTAVVYPSYVGTVRKANRAEAKAELFDFSQRLQRCYTAYGKFNETTKCEPYKQLVASIAPKSRGNEFYEIKFETTPTATKYTLTATAVKAPQTKDTKDNCHVLKLDQNGTKSPAVCW